MIQDIIAWATENFPLEEGHEWTRILEIPIGIYDKKKYRWRVWQYEGVRAHEPSGKQIISHGRDGTEYYGEAPDDPYEIVKVLYGIFVLLDKEN